MHTSIPDISKNDHQRGSPIAKIVLVEYGDYQCPSCRTAYSYIKRLQKHFGDDLLFVFRNFPLEDIHPEAKPAALAAEAAGEQHKFWDMHDIIYENQADLSEESLMDDAEILHLNLEKFELDCNKKPTRLKVFNDVKGGIEGGVNGTPTFFINNKIVDTYDGGYESLLDAATSVRDLSVHESH